MFKLTTPPCAEAQAAEAWILRHSDAYHGGDDRTTCAHCQLMIHYFGPMPPAEDIRAAARAVNRRHKPAYTKAAIPKELRRQVWERDAFTCVVCGTQDGLSIDHIIPESKGGPTTLENCRCLCRSCNSRKGVSM